MMISTRGRYALRILVDLAEQQTEEKVTLRELAERQGISEKYLESIVKELVNAGILEGLRGKGGGYRLVPAPEEIRVLELLERMEGTLAPVACLEDGNVNCERASICPTLPTWIRLNNLIQKFLDSVTLADLMAENERGENSPAQQQ